MLAFFQPSGTSSGHHDFFQSWLWVAQLWCLSAPSSICGSPITPIRAHGLVDIRFTLAISKPIFLNQGITFFLQTLFLGWGFLRAGLVSKHWSQGGIQYFWFLCSLYSTQKQAHTFLLFLKLYWKNPFLLSWMFLARLIPNGPWLSLLHFYILWQHHNIQPRWPVPAFLSCLCLSFGRNSFLIMHRSWAWMKWSLNVGSLGSFFPVEHVPWNSSAKFLILKLTLLKPRTVSSSSNTEFHDLMVTVMEVATAFTSATRPSLSHSLRSCSAAFLVGLSITGSRRFHQRFPTTAWIVCALLCWAYNIF